MDSLPLLKQLVHGVTTTSEEERILGLLRNASASELNALLAGVDVARLVRSVDDHLGGPHLRAELIDLLTLERIGDLSTDSLAELAYGLQAGRTSRHDEEGIRRIFLARTGPDLTHLKNRINMRIDAHDLEGLVFTDVDHSDVRNDILDHIAAQAAGFSAGKAKVLSDIDDTVFARLHDDRYPKGTIYPGVLALLEALDHGSDDQPFSTGDLTFVTARPRDALGLIENHTRTALRRAGIAQSSVLTGSFLNLHTRDVMAAKKMENIHHYHLLFPEYRLLFLGDSGQGDVVVGQKLHEEFPDDLDVVLIHDVVATPEAERAEWAGRGIFFFDTYVGAATVAFDRGLVSARGLRQVVDETRSGLDAARWDSPSQESGMRDLVNRDVAVASGVLERQAG